MHPTHLCLYFVNLRMRMLHVLCFQNLLCPAEFPNLHVSVNVPRYPALIIEGILAFRKLPLLRALEQSLRAHLLNCIQQARPNQRQTLLLYSLPTSTAQRWLLRPSSQAKSWPHHQSTQKPYTHLSSVRSITPMLKSGTTTTDIASQTLTTSVPSAPNSSKQSIPPPYAKPSWINTATNSSPSSANKSSPGTPPQPSSTKQVSPSSKPRPTNSTTSAPPSSSSKKTSSTSM
jgi:hypothetical protein